VLRDLNRQVERADLVHQLALVHDPDDFFGERCDHLLAVQRAAAALDCVKLRIDLVHAINGQIDVIDLIDRQQRDTQLTRLRFRGLGGRDRLNFQAVFHHFAHRIYHMISGRTGAQTDNHAVLYVCSGLIAGQLFHIHCFFLPAVRAGCLRQPYFLYYKMIGKKGQSFPRKSRVVYTRFCSLAALSVFFISMVMVMGPAPPGTGVMKEAFSATAGSTSPQTLPSALRLMPTSMTTAPSLTISGVIKPALPTAATRISARRQTSSRCCVRLWHMVTVPWRCSSSILIGLPTMFDRPTTTHSLPLGSMPYSSSSSITPAGVQGTQSKLPTMILPTLTGWNASTSFFGSIASMTACSEMCAGTGIWHRMPETCGLWLSWSIRPSSSSCEVSAGRAYFSL